MFFSYFCCFKSKQGQLSVTQINNMKNAFILLVLFVFTRCFAQDLLTPTSYGIYDWSGYTESVFQTLLPDIGKRDVLREGSFKTFYLCTPSFTGEYALSVEKGCLTLTRAEKNIWYLLEYGESVFYGNNAAKNKSRQRTSKKAIALPFPADLTACVLRENARRRCAGTGSYRCVR